MTQSIFQRCKAFLALLRVHQYTKNGLLFLPAFFAVKLNDWQIFQNLMQAFLGFSLVASSVYIINDYMDRESDRKHPTKKNRPLASGAISPQTAFVTWLFLIIAGNALVYMVHPICFYLTISYSILNVLYTIRLKHVPILDINFVAIGFVVRLYVGSIATDVKLSVWIIVTTFVFALFIALGKRRDDVLLRQEGKEVRKSVDGYNLDFINGSMMIMASVTIVTYISYTVSPDSIERFGTSNLYTTAFFVLLAIFRYLQITMVEGRSGSPTRIVLKDLFLQMTILGWLATFALLIYGPRWAGSYQKSKTETRPAVRKSVAPSKKRTLPRTRTKATTRPKAKPKSASKAPAK